MRARGTLHVEHGSVEARAAPMRGGARALDESASTGSHQARVDFDYAGLSTLGGSEIDTGNMALECRRPASGTLEFGPANFGAVSAYRSSDPGRALGKPEFR